MASKFDDRRVILSIQVGNNLKTYEGLYITATGTKYANPNQNECEIEVKNLDRATRDAILTDTSPFNNNRVQKKLMIDAGRESYGVSRIFEGDIVTSTISQPPDITLKMKALTGDFQKGKVSTVGGKAKQTLKQMSEGAASRLGMTLNFQATDKEIGNYSYSGASLKELNKLSEAGGVNAYIDNGVLVVKDFNVPLNGRTRILNAATGLVGIPEVTEEGVKATFLLDNQTSIGGGLDISSELNPSLNGVYCIYKLGFNIASRDTPFYWVAEAKRLKT